MPEIVKPNTFPFIAFKRIFKLKMPKRIAHVNDVITTAFNPVSAFFTTDLWSQRGCNRTPTEFEAG